MTPKEKAEELVNTILDKLYNDGSLSFKRILYAKAIECALITVDEIQKLPNIGYNHNRDESQYDYWQEVKQQIEKLKI
jgi:hypothetical protein